MSDLRISALTIDVVRWPLKMKRRHGVGDIERSMPGVIVKLTTDGGIVGWGEAAPWAVFTGTAVSVKVVFTPFMGVPPTSANV